jgi:hypothetical protein
VLPILLLTIYKLSNKKIYLGLIVLSFFGILINGERAAILSSTVVLIFLVLKWYKLKTIFIVISLVLIFLFVREVGIVRLDKENIERISTQKNENEIYLRLAKQYAGILSVLKTPLVGSYFKNYTFFHDKLGGSKYISNTHNAYVNIGMNGGVFGWILLFFFMKGILRLARRMKQLVRSDKYTNTFYHGLIGSFITVLMVGLTHNAGIFNSGEKTAILMLGLIIIGSNLRIQHP